MGNSPRQNTPEWIAVAPYIAADVLTYAGVVAILISVIAVVVGIMTGGGLVRGKTIIFLVGFAMLAYATIRLWPTDPEEFGRGSSPEMQIESDTPDLTDEDDSPIETISHSIPPARWLESPPPEYRWSRAGKLFIASLLLLLISIVLERGFGVG